MAFGPHLAHRFVDDALQLVRVGVGVALLDVLHGSMKRAPAGGFFHGLL